MAENPWSLGEIFSAHARASPQWTALVQHASWLCVRDSRIDVSAWQQIKRYTLRDVCALTWAQYVLTCNKQAADNPVIQVM